MFDQITKFANEATTTVTDAVNDAKLGEQFTTTSDQVLDTVLDVNRRIVDAAVTTVDRVNDQVRNQVELPFADSLPTPASAGERYLEFVERAVSVNRDLNQRIAEMIAVDNATAAAKQAADTATTATKAAATTATSTAKKVAKKAPAKRTAKKAPAKKAAAKKASTTK